MQDGGARKGLAGPAFAPLGCSTIIATRRNFQYVVQSVSSILSCTRHGAIIVELIFDKMVRSLRSGDKIELLGFGCFNARERRARRDVIPKLAQQ
jgi:nucleoid DNA-binding protein